MGKISKFLVTTFAVASLSIFTPQIKTPIINFAPMKVFGQKMSDKNTQLAKNTPAPKPLGTTTGTTNMIPKKTGIYVSQKNDQIIIQTDEKVLGYSVKKTLESIDLEKFPEETDVVPVVGDNNSEKQEFMIILHNTPYIIFAIRNGEDIDCATIQTIDTLNRENTIYLKENDFVFLLNTNGSGQALVFYNKSTTYDQNLKDICEKEGVAKFNELNITKIDVIQIKGEDGDFDVIRFHIDNKTIYGYAPQAEVLDVIQ